MPTTTRAMNAWTIIGAHQTGSSPGPCCGGVGDRRRALSDQPDDPGVGAEHVHPERGVSFIGQDLVAHPAGDQIDRAEGAADPQPGGTASVRVAAHGDRAGRAGVPAVKSRASIAPAIVAACSAQPGSIVPAAGGAVSAGTPNARSPSGPGRNSMSRPYVARPSCAACCSGQSVGRRDHEQGVGITGGDGVIHAVCRLDADPLVLEQLRQCLGAVGGRGPRIVGALDRHRMAEAADSHDDQQTDQQDPAAPQESAPRGPRPVRRGRQRPHPRPSGLPRSTRSAQPGRHRRPLR